MVRTVSIALAAVLFLVCTSFGQDINWKLSKNWKIYDIHSPSAVLFSLDTLHNFKSSALENDSIQVFMNNVIPLPKVKSALWMGSYVATCEVDDGKSRKILISTYGGFFYDQSTERYYQLPQELVDDWLELLNNRSKKMIASD